LANLKRYPEALIAIDQALALNPASAPALDSKGFALYGMGNFSEAIKWYRKAIANDPTLPDLYLHLGQALASKSANNDNRVVSTKMNGMVDSINKHSDDATEANTEHQALLSDAIKAYDTYFTLTHNLNTPIATIAMAQREVLKVKLAQAKASPTLAKAVTASPSTTIASQLKRQHNPVAA
jgi:tetratricopeptide (TPR) repeat protein